MNGYFDHNATTPLHPAAREAWIGASDRFWHNPSSLYREAGIAKRRLEDARESLADRLGADDTAERVVFTSGATEGNNAVMRHAAAGGGDALISAIEHPSVRDAARREFGPERTVEIPVTGDGAADLDWLTDALERGPNVALVSVMAANNETGVLQPWREIGALCRARGVPFHCDAAQWIGKMPAADLGGACDFLTGCAHKFGGPKGTGFLLAPSRGAENFRAAAGGPQENRMRAGTEDLPGILALLAALDDKDDADLAAAAEGRTADRAGFERAVLQALPGAKLVAPDAERLWNTVMLVMPPAHSNLKWLTRLSRLGFAVSTGSACSAGQGNPSHAMAAMGLAPEEMSRVLRVSGGWGTTAADWLALAAALAEVAAELDSGARLDSAAIPGTS